MLPEDQSAEGKLLRSRTMAAVPSERTSLEQLLAREMWAMGVRGWRRHARVEGTRPDFVFSRKRVAVFVDGCFWHGCPECAKRPATNTAYWSAKLARNAARDAKQNRLLADAGWKVLRFWGHELENGPGSCALRVRKSLVG